MEIFKFIGSSNIYAVNIEIFFPFVKLRQYIVGGRLRGSTSGRLRGKDCGRLRGTTFRGTERLRNPTSGMSTLPDINSRCRFILISNLSCLLVMVGLESDGFPIGEGSGQGGEVCADQYFCARINLILSGISLLLYLLKSCL